MIISFPPVCHTFEALVIIPRGSRASPIHLVGSNLKIIAPVDIKPGDIMTVDLRNGHIEKVERCGIAIWRSGWMN